MSLIVNNQTVYKCYQGKLNRCMCGCSGKYKVASAEVEYAGKERGYPVFEEDISDRVVKRITKLILENENKVYYEDDNIYMLEDKEKNKVYYIWLKD
jgi:hypothetical protein